MSKRLHWMGGRAAPLAVHEGVPQKAWQHSGMASVLPKEEDPAADWRRAMKRTYDKLKPKRPARLKNEEIFEGETTPLVKGKARKPSDFAAPPPSIDPMDIFEDQHHH